VKVIPFPKRNTTGKLGVFPASFRKNEMTG